MKKKCDENCNHSHIEQNNVANIEELDASSKSLSDALRISFVVLKIIMIVLVIAFLASGFETVASNEQALVLRFGRIRGAGEQRILTPGPHWIFPYPIDEIIKIPTNPENIPISSFWYRASATDLSTGLVNFRPTDPLNPLLDGYCLTSGEAYTQSQAQAQTSESDYNIVHTRWQLTYQIDNPELFFRNVTIRQVKPGDIYSDIIKQGVTPLLKGIFESSVVATLVNYTIDEAISSRSRIRSDVESLMQQKLDSIECGITVVSVQLVDSVCPPQVKEAFEASTLASQNRDKEITEARSYAEQTLNKTAGTFAQELYDSLSDPNMSEEEREYLWSQLAGSAQEKLTEAKVYAAQVEENAKADAVYLQNLLPEYRQRPELVLQGLYLDVLTRIFSKAEEKFYYQTTEGSQGNELRISLNRDTGLPSTTGQSQTTGSGQ